MTDRFRILALLMTLLPALLAPVGLQVSVCFCWQGDAERAASMAVLEQEALAAARPSESVVALRSDQVRSMCACCRSEQRHPARGHQSHDGREDASRVDPAPCPGCHVYESHTISIDRSKSETVDLDPQLLALVVLKDDVVPAPFVARTRCRTPELRRPIGRTPGAMPLRI
ncbi:hypothetical protein Pla163_04430 [Planctomycetes bacterium Pla163]|uniref:Uncharacterized protein n=1 Tax=Rohdeia mirabilis TaxID=2528008 RepID=A0A518CVW6_9BACT|nr:hypothetical protein Pla163_04430 [Planctomycetes bacterium Pla163]